jgi:hypothetical protein
MTVIPTVPFSLSILAVKLVSFTPPAVCWDANIANDKSFDSTLQCKSYKYMYYLYNAMVFF